MNIFLCFSFFFFDVGFYFVASAVQTAKGTVPLVLVAEPRLTSRTVGRLELRGGGEMKEVALTYSFLCREFSRGKGGGVVKIKMAVSPPGAFGCCYHYFVLPTTQGHIAHRHSLAKMKQNCVFLSRVPVVHTMFISFRKKKRKFRIISGSFQVVATTSRRKVS